MPASAKYGAFAKMTNSDDNLNQGTMAAGDSRNPCLWAQPGTGVCVVYKSSDPQLWGGADGQKALEKLLSASQKFDGLGPLISGGKWMAATSALGASMDLQEAVNFLAKSSADPEGNAKLAKKVFKDLQSIGLAVQKKDQKTALTYYGKYAEDMPALIGRLQAAPA